MLLLAHIDVVEAKREDWTRDPFTLIEENGYFYAAAPPTTRPWPPCGRHVGALQAAEGYRPQRTIKLALTCGEETTARSTASMAGGNRSRADRRRIRPQ